MAPQPFEWMAYLTIAQDLAQQTDEASLRTAISRAHYYVFHLGLQRAESNSYAAVRGESSHIQLWRFFSNSPESIAQQLAQIATRLKEKRERADYNDRYARLAEEVPGTISDAKRFAALLQQLPTRHPNQQSQRQ